MGSYLLMYLWTRINVINSFSIFCLILSAVVYIISFISLANVEQGSIWEKDDNIPKDISNTINKAKKISSTIFCVCLCVILFLPAKKDFIAIYVIPKISNHSSMEEWEKVVNKLPRYIQNMLEEEQ